MKESRVEDHTDLTSTTRPILAKSKISSAIAALIDGRIDIGTETLRIDSRCPFGRPGYGRSRHETVRLDMQQFGNRGSVPRYNQGFTRLHLSEDGTRIVAQFSLGN